MDRLLCVLTPLVALTLWGIISPRHQWRVLSSWSYRDPEANEPSDASYAVTRITGVLVLGALAYAVFFM